VSIPQNTILPRNEINFHLIPGRLRIGVPGLLNNESYAGFLAHRLAKFPGVRLSYANPTTGQLLLNFDQQKTDLALLLSWISTISGKGRGRRGEATLIENTVKTRLPHQQASIKTISGKPSIPWHALDSSKALELFQSSPDRGLSSYTVRKRLMAYGPNELGSTPRISFWKIAFESINGFMTKLLLVAGGVSLLVGETTDAAVIGTIVVIQALVEAAQSCRAEKSLEKLKKLSDPLTTVLREGAVTRIPSKELVPGDILQLNAGDLVPADAMIISASNLLTNEACLTGESIPVVKENQKGGNLRTPIADQANMLFSGTSIIGGRAVALVVATGMQTELGRIACLLGDVKIEKTNLQKQLDRLGKKITQLVALSVGAIALIYLARGRSVIEVLRAGISLAVGAVPEGLPAVLTVALSTGVQRMVKRNAVVRNLAAVETLGSTTVICTDKTGTLTKNEMTAKELYVGGTIYRVTGEGYTPKGQILGVGKGIGENNFPAVKEMLKIAALCSNAELRPGLKGEWKITGDPTEGALLTAAAKAGLWWQDLKNEFPRQQETAFDNGRRMMTVVCRESEDQYGVYVKGAPDAVINYCSTVAEKNELRAFEPGIRKNILKTNEKMAKKALRVLAIAYKRLPLGTDLGEINLDSDLTFCGLIGMSDSPREGVGEAITRCQTAGIKVVMITGDHQKTAEAIAAKLGILGQGNSITGEELDRIPDAEFFERVESIVVYSRTTPDQKLRIVRALKSRGQIVAMTGDGVNDAPAVKEADIGIAMGLSGADVTREVAGITLSDDNFVTIVNGVEEGRTVSMNLSKSVRYILSGSFGQLLAVFTSAATGLPTPLLPSQILWVNLVTESLPAISLTADPPEQNYMSQPPFDPEGRFLPNRGKTIIRKGMLFGLNTVGLFAWGLKWGGWSLNKARTMAFSQLVVNRVFNLLSDRKTKAAQASKTEKNPFVLPAAAVTVSMLAATMYLPFMRPLFATVPIGLRDWALLTANSLLTGKIDSQLARSPIANTSIGGQNEQSHTTEYQRKNGSGFGSYQGSS